jgi:hypothetical protein
MRAVIRAGRLALAAIATVATVTACAPVVPSTTPSTAPARIYGQVLPKTFCQGLDFNPLVAALDAGPIFAKPDFLDHGGVQDQWYACSLSTLKRSDRFLSASVSVRIDLFGEASSATKAMEVAVAKLMSPASFVADSVERAVKDVRPDGIDILILDGNLLVSTRAHVSQGLTIPAAAEDELDGLAHVVLAHVRTSATRV